MSSSTFDTFYQHIRELQHKLKFALASIPTNFLHSGTESFCFDHHSIPMYSFSIRMGTVIHSIPHYQNYLVKIEEPNGYIHATPLRFGSSYPGAATYSTYAPGTRVLVAVMPALSYGFIVGTVPLQLDILANCPVDMAALGSGIPFDWQPYTVVDNWKYSNWCGRTPADSTVLNEFGYGSETGMMLHVDPFYAALKLNPTTGVFISFWDNLLRIAGRYTQEWKAGVSRDYYFDHQRANNFGGLVAYERELTGRLLDAVESSQNLNYDEYKDKPWLTSIEPISGEDIPELHSFYRIIDFSGFLGTGQKTYVCAYPRKHGGFFFLEEHHPIGVAEFGVAFDGSFGVRSSSGIYLSKHPIIVPPIPDKNPADPAIEHADLDQELTEVSLRLGDRPPWEGINGVYFPLAVLDQSLMHFLYRSTYGIRTLKEDFKYPDEDEYINDNELPPPISIGYPQGCSQGRLDMVSYSDTEIEIDEGKWSRKIFSGSSYFACLPDGSIAISDGYGSEIRMGGGKIFISAPYGLFLQSGREIVSFAGGDIIQTANRNIEITAGERAAVSAYENLWLTGGLNETSGRVYIESRSRGSLAGVVISAPFSSLRASAERVNVHAFGRKGETTEDNFSGLIVLEATNKDGEPDGVIAQYGAFVIHDVGCAVIHRCSAKDPPSMTETKRGVDAVYAFTSLAARFGAPLFVTDSIAAKGPIKSIQEINQFSTVPQINECFDFIRDVFDWSNIVCTDSQKLSKQAYDNRIQMNWKKPFFEFRTPRSYGTTRLEYPESRWERDSRLRGSGLVFWEPRFSLKNYDEEGDSPDPSLPYTYSYPGKDQSYEVDNDSATNYDVSNPTQLKVHYSFFDPETGVSKVKSPIEIKFYRSCQFELGAILD